MAQVQLDLSLGLEAFQSQITLAHSKLQGLEARAKVPLGLRAFLDTSTLRAQLQAAQKMLSGGNSNIKIGAELYKKGSQYSISKTKVKKEIIDKIQGEIRDDRDYKLKIGTELDFDPAAIKKQIESGIGTVSIKVDAELVIDTAAITRQIQQAVRLAQSAAVNDAGTTSSTASRQPRAAATAATRQPDAVAVRQLLNDAVAKTQAGGGLSTAEIKKFATEAKKAGAELTATTVTELRKELPSALAKVADDAILGLAKGLVSNESALIDASRQAAESLIKALKKALRIASPSGESKDEVGKPIGEGIGKGTIEGLVQWERRIAGAIRQTIGNAWKQGLARDAAARGALADMGRDAGQIISTSLGKALRQGMASSVAPALKGGLLGGTGGMVTGGLVGGLGAAGAAVKQAVMPSVMTFGSSPMAQKLGMLGQGAASLASGGANDAFNTFLQNSLDSVVQAALSGGGQAGLIGAAGVGGVAAVTGLARGAGGSLVTQAVESIKNRILGAAAEQAQGQMAIPGVTGGAVTAPIQNASNVMGLIQGRLQDAAAALQRFVDGMKPGELQQQIRSFLWNLAIADEQFEVIRRQTQQLGFRMETSWNQMTGRVPQQLLPPQPVPGTGMIRQRNMPLGSVVGRTPFGFIGESPDINEGRGYLERSRRELEPFGRPGEWQIVDKANGVWQRILSDSELAQERLALIAENLTRAGSASYRTWTDRQGVGTFNPFDQAFYRPTRPPQAPPPGGDGTFGGNRFGTPNPGGALALRNVPVEFFTSFRDAERLLAEVDKRLASVAKAFDTLKVKSQLQADQGIRQLEVSLRAVLLAFQKGEVGAEDVRAALYGLNREMAGLAGQTAQVQNLAQAFENLGGMSAQARQAIENQRNEDVKYIQSETARGRDRDGNLILSQEGRRAGNLRDIQQLTYANDLVRGAQSASGFGGFRGREIGNDTLIKALQRTNLSEYLNQFDQLSSTILQTSRNTKVYNQVQAALSEEFDNASRALRVLNGEAKAGETLTQVARNAWGTILDDFQNLVPQLLVFAVAYNLILQRVLTTPGAVIQAAAAFERLETSISSFLSATRGIGDASGVISELRGVALDLGIGFEKAASSYLRFAAATQGTPLEGREVDITRTVATAGRNQGLSGEQIDRASVALTQILSKGRVQSEELRGQLAEQLPGALQIAARAFGVTTKELYRMVEAGQIAGDEFVGRFIGQLKAEGASTNQLAGSFSNVTEQLGSSVQALAATAGQPFLTPLTLALQGVNAVMQALIPVAPVLTGLFVVLGAQALKAALGHVPLVREIVGAARAMFAAKNPAEGYTAGLVRLTGAAKLAATVLKALGTAALIGLAFEALSGAIKFAKGEIGALGDELKKVNKIAEGGVGGGLNSFQKFLSRLNIPKNISDQTTLFDASKIGTSSDSLRQKIIANQKQIQGAIRTTREIDKALFAERLARDKAERDQDTKGVQKAVKNIQTLERFREQVAFAVSPEDAQIQIGANKAAEQAVKAVIERGIAQGRNVEIEKRNLKAIQDQGKAFEDTARKAGLLDTAIARINSLGALQSRLQASEKDLASLDVDSESFRQLQLQVAGQRQAVADQQLLPQERALKTQETVLRRMSVELKVQENIQRIKLGLIENERRQLEANLDLERTRGRLREAVAQRRVTIASTLNAPEERLAAEAELQRVRERNQSRELQAQGQILGKDRERINAETSLQKEQVKIQTQQLAIDKQMLQIERLKLEAAAKTKGVSKDLVRQYYLQMGQIDKTIKATDTLIGQQGTLVQSIEASGNAQLGVLDTRLQELEVQRQINRENSLTEQQRRQIEAAQQDITNKLQASLNAIENAKAAYEQLSSSVQQQLDGVRSLVDAEKERSALAEQTAAKELAAVDRLLELQQGRNEGGFFERMAKASLLGASGEQDAYNLAQRRLELQQQIQQQQIRQKRLELNLKREELRAEEALNALKLKGLRIENEKAKAQARSALETERLKLVTLGDRATPEQRRLLSDVTGLQLQLGGYNPNVPGGGNSQNNAINQAIGSGRLALEQEAFYNFQESQQAIITRDRVDSQNRANNALEKEIQLNEQLFKLDAAQWFGQFLDKTTQLGRTLGVVTTGLSEFRSTVSQAFSDAITNGADASEAIADAGKALAGKFATGLIDELFLKPMEENFFRGIQQLFPDLFKNEQQSLVDSTNLNTSSTDTLTQVNRELINTINKIPDLTKRIDATIPRPTMETPVYRAPENPGLSSQVSAPASSLQSLAPVVGGIANMLPGTRGGPNINRGVSGNHAGRDLGVDVGDPVHARRAGTVVSYIPSFTRRGARYMGEGLRIKYDDGMQGTYGHIQNPAVKEGDRVEAGQFLAKIFADGQNTHLHYELRDQFGKLLEPLKWVMESLKVPAGRVSPISSPIAAPSAPPSQPAAPLPPAVMTPLPGVGGAPPSASNPVPVTVIPFGGSPATLDQAGAMLGNQVSQLDPATAVNWSTLGQNADVASQTLADTTVVTQDAITSVTGLGDSFWAAAGGMDSIATAATNTPNAFMSLNNTISGVVGVLGSLGVGIAGYQQLKKGGTYNTLMGLAGIFGSIGSITGMFTKGGIFGGGRASGGPVKARTPYLVGEQGPELFMSAVDGQILNNGDTQDYFKQTRASLGRVTTRDRDSRSAALPPMAPIDIRYESQTINNVEYVTAEQHRKGMEMAARRGQQLAYQGLQNSVKVRRRLGVS